MIDGLSGLHAINPEVSYPDLLADAIRGFIEYEGSNLRMYYTVNRAPSSHNISGTYTVWRVGYQGHIAGVMTLLPELLIMLAVGVFCISYGAASKIKLLGSFDPSDPACLISAGARGGSKGRLKIPKELSGCYDGKGYTGSIRYDERDGLVNDDKELQEHLLSDIGVAADFTNQSRVMETTR